MSGSTARFGRTDRGAAGRVEKILSRTTGAGRPPARWHAWCDGSPTGHHDGPGGSADSGPGAITPQPSTLSSCDYQPRAAARLARPGKSDRRHGLLGRARHHADHLRRVRHPARLLPARRHPAVRLRPVHRHAARIDINLVAVHRAGVAGRLRRQHGRLLDRLQDRATGVQPADAKLLKHEYIEKSEAFFDKYGKITVVLARFVPVVRTVATVMAGASQDEPEDLHAVLGDRRRDLDRHRDHRRLLPRPDRLHPGEPGPIVVAAVVIVICAARSRRSRTGWTAAGSPGWPAAAASPADRIKPAEKSRPSSPAGCVARGRVRPAGCTRIRAATLRSRQRWSRPRTSRP